MGRPSIRVLVADDFEAFRRLIEEILKNQPELQIVSEASDGPEAVQKARQLKPDLVLLDIGLPTLNGVQAARLILDSCPLSRILFVSQGISSDVVEEGLRFGAMGFVAKTDMDKELLKGINDVLRGETFLSSQLAIQVRASAQVGKTPGNECVFGTSTKQGGESIHSHAAGFYSSDTSLLEDLTRFMGRSLAAGRGAIVVATTTHREGLLLRLEMRGLDMTAAIQQGRYIGLDATEALSKFMLDGVPDRTQFFKLMGDLVTTAADAGMAERRRVAVFGECAQLLWAQGNSEGALQLEKLGNELTMLYGIDILCGYSLPSFQGGTGSYIFEKICGEHNTIYSR